MPHGVTARGNEAPPGGWEGQGRKRSRPVGLRSRAR
jgi:hypothetical protein